MHAAMKAPPAIRDHQRVSVREALKEVEREARAALAAVAGVSYLLAKLEAHQGPRK